MAEVLSDDPNVRRRRLGIDLRRLREAAGLGQREVAARLEFSLSKVIRIEAGAHGVSVNDLKAMLGLYRVTDKAEVNALLDAARESRGKPWWADFSDVVSAPLARLLGHEGMAAKFRISHPLLVPGLLHTQEYAVALFAAFPGMKVAAPKLVALRARRQERVFAQPNTSFVFLIGEAALHQWIGGPGVMRRQLEHLLAVEARDNVSVHIVPFTAGASPSLMTPFVMLRLRETDEERVFVESVTGDQLIDDPERIATYIEYFEITQEMSTDSHRTRTLLQERIDGFLLAERNARDGQG